MKEYTRILDMDNSNAVACHVVVKFMIDGAAFAGFNSIWSSEPLSDDDLAHLQEWIMMDKSKWEHRTWNCYRKL